MTGKKKRIVVIGRRGRLGSALRRAYEKDFEVTSLGRQECCLEDRAALRKALDPIEFDLLINTAALTAVDYCETHRGEALKINAYAVEEFANIASSKGARMINVSTDYVFDGSKKTPYHEDDPTEPISEYGRTKLLGDQKMHAVSEDHLVIRTSWVFGRDKPAFPDWIIHKALTHDSVEVVEDKWGCPAYADDMAEWMRPLLFPKTPIGGVLHLCNSGTTSWLEYGQMAIDCAIAAGLKPKVTKATGIPMDSMEAFSAKRPVHSSLATDRYEFLTGIKPRSWKAALQEYVESHVVPACLKQS